MGKPDFGYPYDRADGREDVGAPDSVLRVLRGGSFGSYQSSVRCASRYRGHPDLRYSDLGFRVVASPRS